MMRILLVTLLLAAGLFAQESQRTIIHIYEENPQYWALNGQPVMLRGGSVEDNLFQINGLTAHLGILDSVGGNYVRCTMSSRDEGNVWSFAKNDEGMYDLNEFNSEYWNRFENFLQETNRMGIVAQIEVWATFDFYRDNWDVNPFNPVNNVNYTAEETGLPTEVKTHPTKTENNFFWSVPAENNQETVLKYQQKFVDKLLSYSFEYPNVLYCMDNETSVTPEWGWYWAKYIREKADKAGVKVFITEMWDPWELSHEMHNATFDHPEIYDFVDVSQNNHQREQAHWNNAQAQRERIADNLRPLNNVKIYGADGGRHGTTRNGIESFWRNLFGGMASARFHRPSSGLGLSEEAQHHLMSATMFLQEFDLFTAKTDKESRLMENRADNEAYCIYNEADQYALFFPKLGTITIKLPMVEDDYTLRWLDLSRSEWLDIETRVQDGMQFPINTPSDDYWIALITKNE